MEINSQTRKKYSIEDCVRMVQMGLTPYEALRACNHTCRKQNFSYELNLCAMNVHERNAAKKTSADTSPTVIDIKDDTSLVNSSVTMQSSSSGNSTTMSNKAISMINEANFWWEKWLVRHRSNIKVDLTTDVVTADLSAMSPTSSSAASTFNTKSKNSSIRVSSSFVIKKHSNNIAQKNLENEQYTKVMEEAFGLLQ